jgi:hypothetical protein
VADEREQKPRQGTRDRAPSSVGELHFHCTSLLRKIVEQYSIAGDRSDGVEESSHSLAQRSGARVLACGVEFEPDRCRSEGGGRRGGGGGRRGRG